MYGCTPVTDEKLTVEGWHKKVLYGHSFTFQVGHFLLCFHKIIMAIGKVLEKLKSPHSALLR